VVQIFLTYKRRLNILHDTKRKFLSIINSILTYAVLSKDQFGHGLKNGDLFWLYVVEYAEKDEFKMYRIQNPPLKANHFMFDDGWRSFAEDTEHGNIQNDEDSKTDEN